MKFEFDKREQPFILDQIHHMAIQAGQVGEREMYRQLMRTANKVDGQRTHSELKPIEYNLILEVSKTTVNSLETEIIPKLEVSDKADKEESLNKAKDLVLLGKSVIKRIEDTVNDSNTK